MVSKQTHGRGLAITRKGITRWHGRRTPIITLLGVALSVVLGAAGPARAELTPAQKQEVREHYDKASRAYDIQKFAEAIDEYQKTYEISGDAAMLFNVAQAYRLNGQPQDALFYYRRYLERSPAAPNRAATEQKIADLEKAIEETRSAAPAAGLAGTVPGAVAAPSPSGAPGPAIPPAAPPPPAAGPAGAAAVAPTVPPPPTFPPPHVVTVEPEAHRDGKRTAALALLAVGGVGLLTAAITGKLAENKADNLTYASMVKGTFDPGTEQSGKRLDNVAVVSVVIGAGAAVTGGILWMLSRHSAASDTSATKAVATGSPSVAPLFGGGTVGASAAVSF